MSAARVVLCTTGGDAAAAEALATALVERRLAACVNVVPGVRSIYRWKDGVEKDDERLLVIKTTAERLEALRGAIVELHSYDVPEVVVLDVAGGHAPYLDWVAESCAPIAGS